MSQVVILAGGMGTRIQSVAGALPKALIPVADKPFIAWQLELLRDHGVQEVLLCLGYQADLIESFVGDGRAWDLRVSYSKEDPARLLGTGGALLNAWARLNPEFGVLYGDSYLPFDYRQPFATLAELPAQAVMCVYRNQDQWDKSNVRVEDRSVVFYSKQAMPGEADCIDFGFSVFRKDVFEKYRTAALPLDLATVLRDLVAKRQLAAQVVAERFYEIGSPAGWSELNALLLK